MDLYLFLSWTELRLGVMRWFCKALYVYCKPYIYRSWKVYVCENGKLAKHSFSSLNVLNYFSFLVSAQFQCGHLHFPDVNSELWAIWIICRILCRHQNCKIYIYIIYCQVQAWSRSNFSSGYFKVISINFLFKRWTWR